MNEKTLQALAGVLRAVRDLAVTLGTGYFVFLTIALVGAWVGLAIYRDRARDRRVNAILEHKEREITRLAEDNRRYREVYLRNVGVPEQILREDADDAARASLNPKGSG